MLNIALIQFTVNAINNIDNVGKNKLHTNVKNKEEKRKQNYKAQEIKFR